MTKYLSIVMDVGHIQFTLFSCLLQIAGRTRLKEIKINALAIVKILYKF